jgi:pimeloyl-ACP methyl ester carboxylesterase
MYFNTFALGINPTDLTTSEDFTGLLESAAELGIEYASPVICRARNFVANGHRFHALEWGDESLPLLLVFHGANQTAHSWDLVNLNLSEKYHIVAVDQRGHGDSEWPRDGDMTIDSMALDAAAIIEQLTPSVPPTIMAHSMGGLMLMNLLSRKARAERAIIVDISPEIGGGPGNQRIQAFIRAAQEWDSVDDYVERVSAYAPTRSKEHIVRTMRFNVMERWDGKLVSKHFPRIRPPEQTSEAIQERNRQGRPTYEDVARIECPVMVVRGEESDILLPEAAIRFADALPDGRLVTVEGAGHNVHSQNTLGLLRAIRPFLGFDA